MQAAIGQAFFSLSIGMGTLMAFGYYMPKEQKVPGASSIVVTADTSVALLAGLAIFPLVFAFPFLDPNAGTELVFKTMSTAFAELGAIGQFVGPLFYLLLAVAALSSMISILEPSVLWVQERMPTTRTRATFTVLAICIILCLISVSGFNVLKDFKVGSLENPFEMMKYIADDFLLLLGGTGISAFVGWRLSKIIDMEKLGFKSKFLFSAWIFILKWVSPIFLMVIWVLGNLERIFFIKFF
jgi:NSS family neurotransmitter:Na+ symporter